MSAPTATRPMSYVSTAPPGKDGFLQLVRAEWTKLRSVRGWAIGVLCSGLLLIVLGLLAAAGSGFSCGGGPSPDGGGAGGGGGGGCGPRMPPTGPGGQAVRDDFYFVHQPLDGDGSITVRVTSLTDAVPGDDMRGSRVRWATSDDVDAQGLRLVPPLDQAWLRRRTIELFRLCEPVPDVPLQGPLAEPGWNKADDAH